MWGRGPPARPHVAGQARPGAGRPSPGGNGVFDRSPQPAWTRRLYRGRLGYWGRLAQTPWTANRALIELHLRYLALRACACGERCLLFLESNRDKLRFIRGYGDQPTDQCFAGLRQF